MGGVGAEFPGILGAFCDLMSNFLRRHELVCHNMNVFEGPLVRCDSSEM